MSKVQQRSKFNAIFFSSYFDDLEDSHTACKMTRVIRQTLFDYFEKVLFNSEGLLYDIEGLSSILDPLWVVEDRDLWLKESLGKRMAKPLKNGHVLIDDTLPANLQNQDLWPTDQEPWISTVLRSWAKLQIDAEREVWDSDFVGYRTRRHDREGIVDDEFRIKRILGHRLSADRETEYCCQWVGFPMPKHNMWVKASWMSSEGVHRAYN